ncbi:MAG: thioredoxin domain-containing protein [Micrococcales bacterium]|nr:thioredoxin domain-containing protein [Micrococcales bacterium]
MQSIPGIVTGIDGRASLVPPAQISPEASRIDVFVDYMCPFCDRFEYQHGSEIKDLVDAGDVVLVTHPLAFLDRMSGDSLYSSRAAAAAYAMAAVAPDRFAAFSQALWTNRPDENTPGLSQDELVALAEAAGIGPSQTRAMTDLPYLDMVQIATALAIDFGVAGTPTILLTTPESGTRQWDPGTTVKEALCRLEEGQKDEC